MRARMDSYNQLLTPGKMPHYFLSKLIFSSTVLHTVASWRDCYVQNPGFKSIAPAAMDSPS